LKDKEPKEL